MVRDMDWGSGVVEDIWILSVVDGAGDVVCMDAVFDVIVVLRRDGVVCEISLDVVDECRVKSAFHVTRASRRSDEIVERVR